MFSGFNNPNFKEQHPYHYLNVMKMFNIHVLFIQDTCGERGCYYLCEHMNFCVERTVKKLIDMIIEQTKVSPDNIITIGSSKGGSAALYYGLKYNYGYIISGVPQIKIISYLKKAGAKVVVDYMLEQSRAVKN